MGSKSLLLCWLFFGKLQKRLCDPDLNLPWAFPSLKAAEGRITPTAGFHGASVSPKVKSEVKETKNGNHSTATNAKSVQGSGA